MRWFGCILFYIFSVSLAGCKYEPKNSTFCVNQLLSIKKISFKPFLGYDEGYDYFLEHANDSGVRACLVNNITNETIIKDPFLLPGPRGDVVLGDVAYHILYKNYGLDFRENLPAHIREDYDRNGYLAYYYYVKNAADGREIIKKNVIDYYRDHQ